MVCIYHITFIHSSVARRLNRFYLLAIVNNAAVNTGLHVSAWISAFSSFGYKPRIGIAESYDNPMFNVLRTAKMFSTTAAPFPISTATVGGF